MAAITPVSFGPIDLGTFVARSPLRVNPVSSQVRTDLTQTFQVNGPKKNGGPTVIFHAYTTIPAPTTVLVESQVRKTKSGIYGYRTITKIPPLVGGHGALTEARIKIGHSYRSGGVKREYLAARCSRNVLKAYGKFIFEDDTIISDTIFKSCQTTD